MNSALKEFLKRSFTAGILIFCFGGAYLHSVMLFTFLLLAILLLVVFFEWPKLVDTSNRLYFVGITLLYPVFPALSLVYLNLRYHDTNMLLPVYPFVVAFVYDTLGYIVGKLVGKHKICPTISPGKTWEGLLGSFGGVLILNLLLLPHIQVHPFGYIAHSMFWTVILSFIFTQLAFWGGMLMSYLKRRKGLKDAGNVLPGHGGFLDRGDSVLVLALGTWAVLLIGVWIR